jgi:carbamoyltransferase
MSAIWPESRRALSAGGRRPNRGMGLASGSSRGGYPPHCVANGKVLREGRFRRLWIQPAAGDAGGALGAALCALYLFLDQPRTQHEPPSAPASRY